MNKNPAARQLFKSSLSILNGNRKLLLFALPYFGILLFLVAYMIPDLPAQLNSFADHHGNLQFRSGTNDSAFALHPWRYPGVLGIYLLAEVLATFMNVALFSQIFRAMEGEPVSIRNGLRFAWQRISFVLLWSALVLGIDLLLQHIYQRLNWGGKIADTLAGISWNIAAQFVIPAMVREDNTNPVDLLCNSITAIKKTFREALVGWGVFGMAIIAVIPVAFVLSIPVIVVAALIGQTWILIGFFALLGLAGMAYAVINGLARDVYRCALYVYAAEGVVPAPFTADQLDAAWNVKKK
jgi:hypothetical protein